MKEYVKAAAGDDEIGPVLGERSAVVTDAAQYPRPSVLGVGVGKDYDLREVFGCIVMHHSRVFCGVAGFEARGFRAYMSGATGEETRNGNTLPQPAAATRNRGTT